MVVEAPRRAAEESPGCPKEAGMRRAIDVRPKADADIEYCVEFIAQDSLDSAARFIDAVQQTLSFITEWPETGRMYRSEHERLCGIRTHAIKGFSNHLVFYRVQGDETVLIVRVLYGAGCRKSVRQSSGRPATITLAPAESSPGIPQSRCGGTPRARSSPS
jgi:plasmid stabilization system protein ParE